MKTRILIALGLCIIFLASCQNHLSREEAKSMITNNENYPKLKTYEITKSYIKDMNTQGRGVTALIGEDEFKEQENAIEHYVALNLLKLEETPHRDETTQFLFGTTIRTWTSVKVILTDEGRKYLVHENDNSYKVKLWETEISQILGIKEMKDLKIAEVEYSLHNINFTPFGELFSDKDEVRQVTVNFSLYDDGWRLR